MIGLLAHSTLALGLVALARDLGQVDSMGFLFGDILAIAPRDLAIIWGGGLIALSCWPASGARYLLLR